MLTYLFRLYLLMAFNVSIKCCFSVITALFLINTCPHAEARDILRGGAGINANSTDGGTSSVGGSGTPASANVARSNARDTLIRTNRTLDAMRNLQTAAREAAAISSGQLVAGSLQLPVVPEGLGVGGLQATGGNNSPSQWIGANAPTQEIIGEDAIVTIKQTTQQALLHWDTFNVGKHTTLKFDQSSGGQNVGQWIAFNKVSDISSNPSQILGNIKADGQIYIINRNGIIFGGSSQVNARGLTVSSLPINDNLIDRGLLNNPDAQFLFSGLSIPVGLNGTPGFTPENPTAITGKYGDVVVKQGAILESPTNTAKVGGRITLVGPNVINQGSILTPDGQAILAAGLQVGFDGHSSSDPSLRGLDVFVGAVSDPLAGLYSGSITQNGVIEAPRGSITLTGREIYQSGGLVSTTSVALNGRIDIQASFNAVSNRSTTTATGSLFLFKNTGMVNLGLDSVIQILPEYDSKETTIGTELALRSKVNISGKTIRIGEASVLLAPNAEVSLTSGNWFYELATPPRSTFVQSGGQVYIEKDAEIDVSGTLATPVSVTQNIVSVDLRSAELADSPLQRIGVLRNATVEVDIRNFGNGWIGTPLANVSGFANLIQRSVGQLTVAGGSVSISSGESVVMQPGSSISVSGGSTLFEGGMIRTTQLMTAGRLVDIGIASPDVIYDGIYDGSFTESIPSKFNVKNRYDGVIVPAGYRYEAGYTEGAAGGRLSINSPSMALDGSLVGHTITGEKQRSTPAVSSSLNLSFLAQDLSYGSLPLFSPTPPMLTFSANGNLTPVAPFEIDANGDPSALTSQRRNQVFLSPELMSKGGFGLLSINNQDGTIIVPENIQIGAVAGSEIAFTASNIAIDGSISIPSGKITFNSPNLSLSTLNYLNNTSGGTLPEPVVGSGVFTLGVTGEVNTSGLRIDDRLTIGTSGTLPLFLSGGSVNINAYSVELSEGGALNVSGGVYIDPRGAVSYGSGGSISLSAGRDLNQTAVLGGYLNLGATLIGFSGVKSGSLALQAPAFQIGGTSMDSRVNVLDPEFFNQGGFGSFSLTGVGLVSDTPGEFITGVFIAPQTVIRPIVTGWLAETDGGNMKLETVTREEGVRAPVSLSFNAQGAINNFSSAILGRGDIVVSAGASILTDAKGSVSFTGETVTLNGNVTSPGGTITVAGSSRYPSLDPDTLLPTALIGNSAYLSTAGKTVLIDNAYNRRQGQVVSGGTISVSGNIVAERGATLDVSGASGILDLPSSQQSLNPSRVNSSSGRNYVPVTAHSNGGRISLSGAKMLYSDASLVGAAGGTSAIGGSVSVSSGRFIPLGNESNTSQTNLIVRQNGLLVPADFVSKGLGSPLIDSFGTPLQGIGNFAVSTFSGGGFDSLSLNGNIEFEGDVSIHTPGSLRVASGGVFSGQGNVNLRSAYVNLGQAFTAPKLPTEAVILYTQTDVSGVTSPYTFSPIHGDGELSIEANLIDVGNLSLDGLGDVVMNASNGDIRGNGTLSLAGILNLTAGQIYPTTASSFDIFVYDFTSGGVPRKGSVSITGGSTRQLPLSAGGHLGVYASQITQGGVLRAPIGTINLGWDGTGASPFNPVVGSSLASPVTSTLTLTSGGVTAVSTVDPLTGKTTIIPYGVSLDGKTWVDPAGNDITVSGVPGKSVNLAAMDLVTELDSIVDISGGGDLYAYRWIAGNGGSEDILASSTCFAVIPSYGFDYMPFAPFNSDSNATNLLGAPGYTNASLKVGDQITLSASKHLSAGTYTLLPARYALLPGSVLITPKTIVPAGTVNSPDGSCIVSGYRSNNLDASRTGPTLIGGFEVATSKVLRARAEYQDLLANTVLREAASSREFSVPRLPLDAGYLAFSSTANMSLSGRVSSIIPTSGRGSLIDINSSSDILINSSDTAVSGSGLVLSAQTLNSFGAESLLIGGLRNFNPNGVAVTVNSANVTLDNVGVALTGNDIILASRDKLTLAENTEITSLEDDSLSFDTLLLGSSFNAGSGNGALVRVSANTSGGISRANTSLSDLPELTVRSGVVLTGGNIIIDSTAGTSLSNSTRLTADGISLSSGQISISLNDPGILNPTNGLTLAGDTFAILQNSSKRLTLQSYSTLDTYGTGTVGSRNFESLSLQASSIRGFNTNGGSVIFTAAQLSLGNRFGGAPSLPMGSLSGSAAFDADQITFESNSIRMDGYLNVILAATGSILTRELGSLDVAGDLNVMTQLLTGANASKYQIRSIGELEVSRPVMSLPFSFNGGFGADITLQGSTVKVNSDITLPSGNLTLRATSGDLTLGDASTAHLDLAGTSKQFIDTVRYTSGGTVSLTSDIGSVSVLPSVTINVSAEQGGGHAGSIQVKAPVGKLDLVGVITGIAGETRQKGRFSLDIGTIPSGSLAAIDAILNAGSFNQSRDYRIRTGDVAIDGFAASHIYQVSADSGNIAVFNTIDASGSNGGVIDLKANGSLTLSSGSLLNASATRFDSAGKGGAIVLEAGNQRNGDIQNSASLDLQAGSAIDLSVAEANVGSEALGKFTGTLHLRAPRNANNTDLNINSIGSSIQGASSILVEGVKLYKLTDSGVITSTIQNKINSDAASFLGAAGMTTTGYTAMLNRLISFQPNLDLILAPGVEIYNLNGNLTLGASNSSASSDWNLATYRFGPRKAAGVLTLRASENLVFLNALSDGFSGGSSLWLSSLMDYNPLLPANSQSWSLRMTAGSDQSAADFRAVRSLESIGAASGFLQLGKNTGAATVPGGANARTSSLITNLFQVIRTGSGNIDINTGRSLQFLNPFASIYTAGTSLASATTVSTSGDFVIPIINRNVAQGNLGTAQQNYLAQYSMAGGNVTINSGENIERKTVNNSGFIDDSSRQLPNNWLYRRGYVGENGEFGRIRIGTGFGSTSDASASTTWWIDFSNFFQDVGALGGGNVSLTASRDIMNISAAIPTNARAAMGIPSAESFIELGGGDLHVNSGKDISGGVYYVERGQGTLHAGGSITTNGTRSPSFGLTGNLNNPAASQLDSLTWMPTSLFVGKSSFDLTAANDLLMGPIGNPFLLPQGIGNKFWYKTYFSTISSDSNITALSLGGDVTIRNAVTLPNQTQAKPMLQAWHETQLLLTGSVSSTSWLQPWLRLAETSLDPFSPVWGLSTANLSLTSISGDMNLAGDLTIFPSAMGQMELLAAGAINALQPTGLSVLTSGESIKSWVASTLNLSDANPASIPQKLKPLTSVTSSVSGAIMSSSTTPGFMNSLTDLFSESGSMTGINAVLQTRQARHTPGGLHDDDEQPVRIYALDGNLSGLTLYSGKQAFISAATDITDVALYIQNNSASDATRVTAGRDIIAYNSASSLRVASIAKGNGLSTGQSILSGDIQISGPGSLMVLAGRNLDLGYGSNNADGTGTGITSIGNLRNPYLVTEGADLLVAAGIGPAANLSGSLLAFDPFITQFASSPEGNRYLAEAKGILGITTDFEFTKTLENGVKIQSVSAGGSAETAGLQSGDVILRISDKEITSNYDDSYLLEGIVIGEKTKIQILRDGINLELDITPGSDRLHLEDPSLTPEQKKQLALSIFHRVLRDTGRDFNNPEKVGYRKYDAGFAAIKSLFPESISWVGEILTQGRDIRTRSGGDISILAPGGGLTMANSSIGNPLTPPGIVTESGGNVSVFANQSVGIGIGRIFTLKGGNVAIWSSEGDIAAGSSSRTVSAAPPTRVVIDPQSASVETDLAGLATGGGIGVLATVEGVAPGNVDLIAPAGIIDAGDAGIRVSGNINLAAVTIVNAGNISAGGVSVGAPATSVSAPSISTVTSSSNYTSSSDSPVGKPSAEEKISETAVSEEIMSLYSVEVIGYGGGGDEDELEEEDKKNNNNETQNLTPNP